MRPVGTVKSYIRRRIRVPVNRRSLVLDVGSGDHPHWRADVLLDQFPDAASDNQRYKGAPVRIDRPLFQADAASMPFADHAFDYAICTHVLEHVARPDLALRELSRVAKAGYVEVPRIGMAKILDLESHLWYCRLDEGVLEFVGKSRVDFDPDIATFVNTSGLDKRLLRLFARSFDVCVIGIEWRGSIASRVIGCPSDSLIDSIAASPATVTGRSAPLALAEHALRRVAHRQSVVRWNTIVLPALRSANDFVLTAGVYRSEPRMPDRGSGSE